MAVTVATVATVVIPAVTAAAMVDVPDIALDIPAVGIAGKSAHIHIVVRCMACAKVGASGQGSTDVITPLLRVYATVVALRIMGLIATIARFQVWITTAFIIFALLTWAITSSIMAMCGRVFTIITSTLPLVRSRVLATAPSMLRVIDIVTTVIRIPATMTRDTVISTTLRPIRMGTALRCP